MTLLLWLIVAAGWLLVVLFAWSLCRAAAIGDRRLIEQQQELDLAASAAVPGDPATGEVTAGAVAGRTTTTTTNRGARS